MRPQGLVGSPKASVIASHASCLAKKDERQPGVPGFATQCVVQHSCKVPDDIKKQQHCCCFLVRPQGLEPWTHWLRVSCSTNWAKDAYLGDNYATSGLCRSLDMFERPFLIVLFAYAWSGRRDSDPRLSPWQGDTLPLSHSRKHKLLYQINRQKATIFRYKNKKFFGFTFINCRFSNLLYIVCFYGIINVLPNADVVELADTQDLGSCTRVCRFDSCHPHQLLKKRTLTGSFFNRWLVDGFATMKCDACIAFFYS